MAKKREVEDLEDPVTRANNLGILGAKAGGVQPTQPAASEQPPAVQASPPLAPVLTQTPTTTVQEVEAPPKLTKCTFYLSDEDILALDELQSDEFRKTRRRPDRSQLVRQAIQQFHAAHKQENAH